MSKGKIYLIAVLVCVFNFQVTKVGAQDMQELGYAPGELLVRFSPKNSGIQLDTEEKNTILISLGGSTVKYNFKIVPGLCLVELPENQTVKEVLQTYNSKEGILYAEPNYKLEIFNTIPNDPRYIEQWGLNNTGQSGGTEDADIDAPGAWDIRKNVAPNIIVAVIDTGVDYNHPDLVDNMWINVAEMNGDPNVDDDGNGFFDDIYGYDFCAYGGKQRDSDPIDDKGHGTHVAGIIGALGNNEEGVAGVCWNVKMMAIKSQNYNGQGSVDDARERLEKLKGK